MRRGGRLRPRGFLGQRDPVPQIGPRIFRKMLDSDARPIGMGALGEFLRHVELAEPVQDREVFGVGGRSAQSARLLGEFLQEPRGRRALRVGRIFAKLSDAPIRGALQFLRLNRPVSHSALPPNGRSPSRAGFRRPETGSASSFGALRQTAGGPRRAISPMTRATTKMIRKMKNRT